MKAIYEYQNHLDFLSDFYSKKKSENSGFSYTVWARKMAIKSSSALSMVMNGDRLPSKDLVKKISTYMGLDSREEEHFKTLIDLSKVRKNPRLSIVVSSELPGGELLSEESAFLSPMTFIIKELIEARGENRVTSQWLKEKLLVKHQQYNFDSIIRELIQRDILQERYDGSFLVKEKNLVKILSSPEQIKKFHFETQELVKQAYETTTREERTFHTSFVRLKKDKLAEAKQRLQAFQKEFSQFVEEGESQSILYQVNFQLFPLSKVLESESENVLKN